MNRGKKVSAISFMFLAIVAFTFGSIFALPMMSPAEESTEQLAKLITTVVLIAPYLICYIGFAIFDMIEFCLSISLIKDDSKGLGWFNLILSIILFIAAVVITLKLFTGF